MKATKLTIFSIRTSLFIVGSSTYAQLLIVVCIVAALAEVVTHNVPFQYFEVSASFHCQFYRFFPLPFPFLFFLRHMHNKAQSAPGTV